jgi:murein DD-endopeptidase MepM/ murein hydrolase activator NlpD
VAGALTRRFDPPAVPWGSGHRGVDLAATPGEEVRSPGPGVVTFAGVVVGRGVVTVRHPDGLRSSLEPVTAAVRTGDEVATGAVLGTLEAGGTHLGVHWGVRDADGYRDPLGLLPDAGRVVLLPVP